jgi:hypothetical protein
MIALSSDVIRWCREFGTNQIGDLIEQGLSTDRTVFMEVSLSMGLRSLE